MFATTPALTRSATLRDLGLVMKTSFRVPLSPARGRSNDTDFDAAARRTGALVEEPATWFYCESVIERRERHASRTSTSIWLHPIGLVLLRLVIFAEPILPLDREYAVTARYPQSIHRWTTMLRGLMTDSGDLVVDHRGPASGHEPKP